MEHGKVVILCAHAPETAGIDIQGYFETVSMRAFDHVAEQIQYFFLCAFNGKHAGENTRASIAGSKGKILLDLGHRTDVGIDGNTKYRLHVITSFCFHYTGLYTERIQSVFPSD